MDEHKTVAEAYKENAITTDQLIFIIQGLPCYAHGGLRPGNRKFYKKEPNPNPCDTARKSHHKRMVKEYHSPIPGAERTLHEVCLTCPAFAPALIALTGLLPKPRQLRLL